MGNPPIKCTAQPTAWPVGATEPTWFHRSPTGSEDGNLLLDTLKWRLANPPCIAGGAEPDIDELRRDVRWMLYLFEKGLGDKWEYHQNSLSSWEEIYRGHPYVTLIDEPHRLVHLGSGVWGRGARFLNPLFDLDGDGMPDAVTPEEVQRGKKADAFPADRRFWGDADHDAVPDSIDLFPDDPKKFTLPGKLPHVGGGNDFPILRTRVPYCCSTNVAEESCQAAVKNWQESANEFISSRLRGVGWQIELVPGKQGDSNLVTVGERPPSYNLGIGADKFNWPLSISGAVVAHEVGHHIGLPDRYINSVVISNDRLSSMLYKQVLFPAADFMKDDKRPDTSIDSGDIKRAIALQSEIPTPDTIDAKYVRRPWTMDEGLHELGRLKIFLDANPRHAATVKAADILWTKLSKNPPDLLRHIQNFKDGSSATRKWLMEGAVGRDARIFEEIASGGSATMETVSLAIAKVAQMKEKHASDATPGMKDLMPKLTAVAEKLAQRREILAAAERQKFKSMAEELPCYAQPDFYEDEKYDWYYKSGMLYCKVGGIEATQDQVVMQLHLDKSGDDSLPPYIQWSGSLRLPAVVPDAKSAMLSAYKNFSVHMADGTRKWFLGGGIVGQVAIMGRNGVDEGLGVSVKHIDVLRSQNGQLTNAEFYAQYFGEAQRLYLGAVSYFIVDRRVQAGVDFETQFSSFSNIGAAGGFAVNLSLWRGLEWSHRLIAGMSENPIQYRTGLGWIF